MTERAPFNPWENPQDKLIADYNTISNQSGAVIICSDALLCDGLETILQEACQEDSRLQSPDILLSGIELVYGDDTTGDLIPSVTASTATKVLSNSNLYIVKNGVRYTILGSIVSE